jgi:hypothetical protein
VPRDLNVATNLDESKFHNKTNKKKKKLSTRSSWRGRADTYIPTEQQQTNLTVKSEEKL